MKVGSRKEWVASSSRGPESRTASATPDALLQSEIDEQAARQREMLAAKREENIRRREQQTREREAQDERIKSRNEQLEAKRQTKIRGVEEKWMAAQEQQRDRDDALVAFIRTARERRDRERELENQDKDALHRREDAAVKFYELERRREQKIREREEASNRKKLDSNMQDAITQNRKGALSSLRETNVRRIEDDAMEKAHAFRVAERDRELIKEARERRLKDKKDRARKAAEDEEARRFVELEQQVAEKRAMNIKIREDSRSQELNARRERERRIMEEAQAIRQQERHSLRRAEEAESELMRRQQDLQGMQNTLDVRREHNIASRGR